MDQSGPVRSGPLRSTTVSPPSDPTRSDPTGRPGVPPPLTVAVSLAAVEAAVLVLLGFAEVVALQGERLVMGVTTVAFFWLYGGFLAFAAYRLWRLEAWARAPIVLAQLIQVMVGVSFWGGETTVVAVLLVVSGLITLAGVFHPASLAAVESD